MRFQALQSNTPADAADARGWRNGPGRAADGYFATADRGMASTASNAITTRSLPMQGTRPARCKGGAGRGSVLGILFQLSMHRLKQRLDVVLVTSQIRREVGALRQAQAGASGQKIDDLRAAG